MAAGSLKVGGFGRDRTRLVVDEGKGKGRQREAQKWGGKVKKRKNPGYGAEQGVEVDGDGSPAELPQPRREENGGRSVVRRRRRKGRVGRDGGRGRGDISE